MLVRDHIALVVRELEPVVGRLGELARPGVGTRVEVHQGEASYAGTPLVARLELPVAEPAQAVLVAGLGGR